MDYCNAVLAGAPKFLQTIDGRTSGSDELKTGALKTQDLKMQDMKLTDQITGHDFAGHEIDGPNHKA